MRNRLRVSRWLTALFFLAAVGTAVSGHFPDFGGSNASDPGIGFVSRSDWMGDPYLLTNPPNNALSPYRVNLVLNPLLMTNPAYAAKVTALTVATKAEAPEGRSWLGRLFQPSSPPRSEAPAVVPGVLVEPVKPLLEEETLSWSGLVERWLLLLFVSLLLAWRLWRYFFVQDEEDDFANYLATLAVAHRWVFPVYMLLLVAVAVAELLAIGNLFFSLSLLAFASSLRRCYCEGDFVDSPWAQKVHLALSLGLIWLGWQVGGDHYLSDLSTWAHGLVLAWVMLAVVTWLYRQLYNSELAQFRSELFIYLSGLVISGLLGGAVGHYLWSRGALGGSAGLAMGAGALIACLPLLLICCRRARHILEQQSGAVFYDFLFSEGWFAEKVRRQKSLPEIVLLEHWRNTGETDKAWRTAESHLLPEPRALPVWLFALETAVLHRRRPDEAMRILRRLCECREFSPDQRIIAVAEVEGWMRAAGHAFNADLYQVELPPPNRPTALTDLVEEKCRAGRFREAAGLLQSALDDDPLNEAAFVQLVRITCQDLKNRPAAERLIAGAQDTFGPNLLNYLQQSLNEWLQLPVRSQAKPRGRFGWGRGQEPEAPKKLQLSAPPITRPPVTVKTGDGMESYMDRVRAAQGKPASTVGVFDPVEKLLLERRLGMAVELIKQKAEAAPKDFDLWLRYAAAHGDHCGDVTAAEKIIRQMDRSGNFKKAQMKKARTRLKQWTKRHAPQQYW